MYFAIQILASISIYFNAKLKEASYAKKYDCICKPSSGESHPALFSLDSSALTLRCALLG